MENNQIVIENLTKTYGKHRILDGISFKASPGDFICIFGKSGSGKTTLLNIMGALEDYQEGKVVLFSKMNPIRNRKMSETIRRNDIAYLFQDFALVDYLTVKENLKLALKYNKEVMNHESAMIDVLEKVQLKDKLDMKVFELSGGEQQRIALARNMLKPYDVLLADEPTGSLDQENREMVIRMLQELNQSGKTIIVVSHDPVFREVAHQSYYLQNGTLRPMS